MGASLRHLVYTALPLQGFCWLCGHATGYSHTWTEIANHSCGRYKEEADKRIDQAQRNNKRYQHYCLRWWGALGPTRAFAPAYAN